MGGTPSSVDTISDLDAPEVLFLEHLETIERAIRFVCRRGALQEADIDDFGSYVKLKLIENDYAVIRKYERRASFSAFIGVVVQRMFLDYRIAQWGKWHASAVAKKLGDAAVMIEAMIRRDGRSVEEILPMVLSRWPNLTATAVEAIVRQLPVRAPRARDVRLDVVEDAQKHATDGLDDLFQSRRAEIAKRIAAVVRSTMAELDERDRLIFRLCFDGGMSVAEISRTLRTEQKPLYRRLRRALSLLRKRLEHAGIDAADAEEIVAMRDSDLDFGFGGGTPIGGPHTNDEEGS